MYAAAASELTHAPMRRCARCRSGSDSSEGWFLDRTLAAEALTQLPQLSIGLTDRAGL
jgi:hypothetical protein